MNWDFLATIRMRQNVKNAIWSFPHPKDCNDMLTKHMPKCQKHIFRRRLGEWVNPKRGMKNETLDLHKQKECYREKLLHYQVFKSCWRITITSWLQYWTFSTMVRLHDTLVRASHSQLVWYRLIILHCKIW